MNINLFVLLLKMKVFFIFYISEMKDGWFKKEDNKIIGFFCRIKSDYIVE